MTRLERRTRKEIVRSIHSPSKVRSSARGGSVINSPLHPKTMIEPPTFVSRSKRCLQSMFMGSTPEQKSKARPMVGPRTEEIMRIETENLFSQHDSGNCTMYQLARALKGNNDLMATHVEEGDKNDALVWIIIKRIRRTMHLSESDTARRYQLINALYEVETAPGALKSVVDTWPRAREILSRAMDFRQTIAGDASSTITDVEEKMQLLSDYSPATGTLIPYQAEEVERPQPSTEKWQQISAVRLSAKLADRSNEEKGAIELELELERAKREEEAKRKQAHHEEIERQMAEKEKEEEAKRAATSMLREFTEEEEKIVRDAIYGSGPPNEVLRQVGGEAVTRASMQKLAPGQWVGDEAITCFLLGLAKRDEELCREDPNRKRCHFFNSFFMTKLLNEGHDTKDGVYEYKNVKRWSKKVPGKDIFNLDKIIFPINEGRMHWVCAVVFMQEKRIQFYDSMGADGMHYLKHLFHYIQDEHESKKGSPLPDLDDWQLVPCTDDTPRQGNGFDCGVFLCTFADFVSMDYPLAFNQEHINKCRKRIALSIMRGQAIV